MAKILADTELHQIIHSQCYDRCINYLKGSHCRPRVVLSMVLNISASPSSLTPLTSSLNGIGGIEGSRENNSSHRSAFMHRTRLSTSLAIGPIVAVTAKKMETQEVEERKHVDFYALVYIPVAKKGGGTTQVSGRIHALQTEGPRFKHRHLQLKQSHSRGFRQYWAKWTSSVTQKNCS